MTTEKEVYLNRLVREVQTTVKVLKNYPVDKADLRPAEILKNARELTFVFVSEMEALAMAAIRGKMNFENMPQLSGAIPEIIARFEKSAAELAEQVKAMPDADFNGTMDFMTGPGKIEKVRRADILWLSLYDMIHHRGQFSVYLRMAGGKVPSIYGPSHDEPWR